MICSCGCAHDHPVAHRSTVDGHPVVGFASGAIALQASAHRSAHWRGIVLGTQGDVWARLERLGLCEAAEAGQEDIGDERTSRGTYRRRTLVPMGRPVEVEPGRPPVVPKQAQEAEWAREDRALALGVLREELSRRRGWAVRR